MAYEDFQTKPSLVIVYTGENKGKTSASLGLSLRALGQDDWRVAFVQFIKTWPVGEHKVLKKLAEVYDGRLSLTVGGKGFYNAGEVSAKNVSEDEHKKAAQETYLAAKKMASSGDYNLVVCDEILNAVHDGLLSKDDLLNLIQTKHQKTNLCLTGRNFPAEFLPYVDIATEMRKLKHHYDDKFLANKGIDY
jgi:cob(I)alamin adenosyltransferase